MKHYKLERALRLEFDTLSTLTETELLVLDALRPAGRVVPHEQLARVRVDAGAGPVFGGAGLQKVASRLRPKLRAASDGRLGVAMVRRRGLFLSDEGAGDWAELATLRFSRTALVAEVAGRRAKLTLPLAFVLDVLVRAHVERGADGFATRHELLLALGAVSPPPPGLEGDFDLELDLTIGPRWHARRLTDAMTALRQVTGLRTAIDGRGYRLVLPPERTDP